ncbi:MAG: MAPEG family protein [Labilithrix sp.]|nr:MAPEG family protein [Labilithrix sp.]MCW5831767.1 MAPEG family protein [Labilithrix sp.]
MGIPVVTALYGSLNAILNVALASRVSTLRMRKRVSIGEGDSEELRVAVRIHANNAEFVPLALVVLLLAELCGGASLWLHVAGGALLAARVMHAVGMPRPAPNVFRFMGTAITWIGIVAIACWVLWLRRGS